MYELYPLLAGYTNKCKMMKTKKATRQLTAGNWLMANKKTGNRKNEK
jgi:hypothetical protein